MIDHPAEANPRGGSWPVGLLLGAGFASMYGPTLVGLFSGAWARSEQGHGPIVLAVAAWLLARALPDAVRASGGSSPVVGGVLLAIGFSCYLLGRSQDVQFLEVGSLVLVLVATIQTVYGHFTLRRLWFPLFFMGFMVPLPGLIVDTLTVPLKVGVSWAVEYLLAGFGYPIARSGVILQIGQYQLLVADVCAGLQTLFTLEAMGLLYLNLVRHETVLRNLVLAALIVPISFCANVIRVSTLTLVTYHFGDDAGQGFLHGFAGMVLFVSALVLIVGADGLIRRLLDRRARPA